VTSRRAFIGFAIVGAVAAPRGLGAQGRRSRVSVCSRQPVEQSSRFELVVNMKTARTLGVTIPEPVLLRADQVLE